jgi:hypothetical protein
MGVWTTHVRIPVADWRESPDVNELIINTEHKVRSALRGAAGDPEVDTQLWWHAIIPGQDPTAHEGSTDAAPYGRGETMVTWRPGEQLPNGAELITCRGRAVT